MPVELVLMITFAQWRFIASVILLLLLIACEAALFIKLGKDEHGNKITKKRPSVSVYKRFVTRYITRFSILVSTLDWDNPALHTAYFKKLQSWLQNQEDYKSAWAYGFDAYKNQPLEVTARNYSPEETAKTMKYVRSHLENGLIDTNRVGRRRLYGLRFNHLPSKRPTDYTDYDEHP